MVDGSARPDNVYNICQQSYQKWKSWGNARSTAELPRVCLSAWNCMPRASLTRLRKVYAVNGCLFVPAQLSTNWNGGGRVSTRASNGRGRGDVGTFRGASVSLPRWI